jgi:ATP-dependent 26S proteasome regulatory subunit
MNEYELRIATQLVTPDMGIDWSEIGGYENIISDLHSRVLKPLQAKSKGRLPSSSLLTPARGILLYGSPVCYWLFSRLIIFSGLW